MFWFGALTYRREETLQVEPSVIGRSAELEEIGAWLTVSERRIAELAAAGMTNKQVATAAFVSPKTVEANLARAYAKLGIRSRAQLARALDASKDDETPV